MFAQADDGDDDTTGTSRKTEETEGKADASQAGILFAPGVGIDYDGDSVTSQETERLVADLGQDGLGDQGNGSYPYGTSDASDDLDEPIEIVDDMDEPEGIGYSGEATFAGTDGTDDQILVHEDDDRIPLKDDEEDQLIDIFDDLDKEGIKTSESLMEEVYPSYPESEDAEAGHPNYSGFQFAWSGSDTASTDGTSDVAEETPAAPEFDYGAGVVTEPSSEPFDGTQEGQEGYAESASDGFVAETVTQSFVENDDQYAEQEAVETQDSETMTTDGYPLSNGTDRGITEEDRSLVRKTFKRMLIVVLVVALIAVVGIVILSMNGTPIFPMLSF